MTLQNAKLKYYLLNQENVTTFDIFFSNYLDISSSNESEMNVLLNCKGPLGEVFLSSSNEMVAIGIGVTFWKVVLESMKKVRVSRN